MDFGESIMQIRESHNISRKEFAESLGIPYTTLRNYETGQREPGHKTLINMANILSVSVDELLGFHPQNNVQHLSLEAKKIGIIYDSLDGHGQRMVRIVADEEKNRMELEAKARKEREAMEAAVLSGKEHGNVKPFRKSIQPCSAGTGVYLGPEEFEIIYVEENDLTTRGDFAVPVSGDSMEPTYHDGDILVIEAMEDIPIGKIGLFTMDGEGYVKQRGADALISLNPQYDPLPMREGIRCNGLVIGILDPACLK